MWHLFAREDPREGDYGRCGGFEAREIQNTTLPGPVISISTEQPESRMCLLPPLPIPSYSFYCFSFWTLCLLVNNRKIDLIFTAIIFTTNWTQVPHNGRYSHETTDQNKITKPRRDKERVDDPKAVSSQSSCKVYSHSYLACKMAYSTSSR